MEKNLHFNIQELMPQTGGKKTSKKGKGSKKTATTVKSAPKKGSKGSKKAPKKGSKGSKKGKKTAAK